MKKICIEFIRPSEMRIPGSLGDYWHEDNSIQFRIAKTGNPIYDIAITLHELWEEMRTREAGIPEESIQAWDAAHADSDDPGWESGSPYMAQHQEGELFERLAITLSGNLWRDYCAALDKL